MARLTDRELDLIQQARRVPSWPSWEEVDAILLAARQARAKTIARWIRQGLAPLADAVSAASAMAGRVILPLRRDLLRRRTVTELYQLEDHILADIGIARDQVEPVAANLALAALPPKPPQAGLVARLASWLRCRKAIRQLEALDDRRLADIGLQRGNIREAVKRASTEALQASPAAVPTDGGPSALRTWVPVRQAKGLIGLIRRRLQRRAAIRKLEALDDRMLADIGVLRQNIPAALDQEAAGGRRAAAAPTIEQANYWDSVVRVLRNWEVSREAARKSVRGNAGAATDLEAAEDNFNRGADGLAESEARRHQAA